MSPIEYFDRIPYVLLAASWAFFWWDTRQHNKELEYLNERLKALAEKAKEISHD